jgi:hypothetical protein
MQLRISGRITREELSRGEKPEFIYLHRSRNIIRRCLCGNRNCTHFIKHGYKWDVEWVGDEESDAVSSEVLDNLVFWKGFLVEIYRHQNSNHKHVIEPGLYDSLYKILDNRVKKWKMIKDQIP